MPPPWGGKAPGGWVQILGEFERWDLCPDRLRRLAPSRMPIADFEGRGGAKLRLTGCEIAGSRKDFGFLPTI